MNSATVTGAIVGLLLASGVLLVVHAWIHPRDVSPRRRRLERLLDDAGVTGLRPATLVATSVAAALVATVAGMAATGMPVAALLAGVAAGATPVAWVHRRARSRVESVRKSWPDAVDALSSGVRAGLALPDAVAALSHSGPEPLRPLFSAAAREYRASGSFAAALDVLTAQAHDGVADRVVAALRLGREVGGTSVGEVLRTLSTMLREEARLRSEIRGRQSWTVSAARMSVAAPWLTLLLLSTRPETVAAFATPAGAVILIGAAVTSALAYLLMQRAARLPDLPRLASS